MKNPRNRARAALVTMSAIAIFASAAHPLPAMAMMLHFRMDPATCVVSAAVAEPIRTLGGDAEGTFKIIDGEIFFDPNNPATGTVKVVLDATSYHSNKPERDREVTSSSLESDTYPTIRFESTSLADVALSSATDGSATVNGDLTLHGRTLPISVPVSVEITTDQSKAVAEGQVSFKYSDWGVKVPTMLFIHAGDETTISFHIAANRVIN